MWTTRIQFLVVHIYFLVVIDTRTRQFSCSPIFLFILTLLNISSVYSRLQTCILCWGEGCCITYFHIQLMQLKPHHWIHVHVCMHYHVVAKITHMDNIPAQGDSQDGLLLKVLFAKALFRCLFTVGAVGRAAGRGAVFTSRGILTWRWHACGPRTAWPLGWLRSEIPLLPEAG